MNDSVSLVSGVGLTLHQENVADLAALNVLEVFYDPGVVSFAQSCSVHKGLWNPFGSWTKIGTEHSKPDPIDMKETTRIGSLPFDVESTMSHRIQSAVKPDEHIPVSEDNFWDQATDLFGPVGKLLF